MRSLCLDLGDYLDLRPVGPEQLGVEGRVHDKGRHLPPGLDLFAPFHAEHPLRAIFGRILDQF